MAQKHMDPTDPDPQQRWERYISAALASILNRNKHVRIVVFLYNL